MCVGFWVDRGLLSYQRPNGSFNVFDTSINVVVVPSTI